MTYVDYPRPLLDVNSNRVMSIPKWNIVTNSTNVHGVIVYAKINRNVNSN